MTEPLASWTHRTGDVPERGLEVSRSATPEEREAIARALDLVSLASLDVRYRLREAGDGKYRMTGSFTADAVQSCVVTLEPVPAHIEEELDEDFWPPEDLPVAGAGLEAEQEALAAVVAEPIENGRLATGRIIYERFATALDPFPRKAGAELEHDTAGNVDDQSSGNPFAVLARLKKET